MIRRPPRSTLFPTRRSSDLLRDGVKLRSQHSFRADLAYDGSEDRKSTRLNSSHQIISYAVFCLKKKKGILALDGRSDLAQPELAQRLARLGVVVVLLLVLGLFVFFFFNDTATTEIYTLSLHDALPIDELALTGLTGERLFRAAKEL